MKRSTSGTASDRIQKKAAATFATNLSCKTTSIVHDQSYLEHIALLKIADDMPVVRNGTHAWSHGTTAWLLEER